MHNDAQPLFNEPFRCILPLSQGLDILWTVDPRHRSQARFALGYLLSCFQFFKAWAEAFASARVFCLLASLNRSLFADEVCERSAPAHRNWGDQPDSHRHKRLHGAGCCCYIMITIKIG